MEQKIWSKVILLGDSLTQHSFDVENGCWGSMLANNLVRISDVLNRGYSGYSSRCTREVLPEMFSKDDYEKTACFVIFLGANDCVDNRSFQSVPIDQYEDNMRWIVNYIKGQGVPASRIVIMAPPIYNHEDYQKANGNPPNMAERHPEGFADVAKKIAKEAQVECLDLYSISKNHSDPRSLLSDGLHLSKTGAKVILNSLWPLVKDRVTAFHGSFEQKFPPFDEIEKRLNKEWKQP